MHVSRSLFMYILSHTVYCKLSPISSTCLVTRKTTLRFALRRQSPCRLVKCSARVRSPARHHLKVRVDIPPVRRY